jgi:hypothetical protein
VIDLEAREDAQVVDEVELLGLRLQSEDEMEDPGHHVL